MAGSTTEAVGGEQGMIRNSPATVVLTGFLSEGRAVDQDESLDDPDADFSVPRALSGLADLEDESPAFLAADLGKTSFSQ
jgi:hypothetical protein